jgi:hypothetical protein
MQTTAARPAPIGKGSGNGEPETPGARASASLGKAFRQFLGHGDNLIYLVPCLLGIAFVAVRDPRPLNLLWFLAGWAFFLPQEYLSHIYILHFPIPKSWGGYKFYRLMYRLHYGHHDFPKRFDLMFIPVWLTLPLAFGNMAVFRLVTADPYVWTALTAGLFAGYLFFEWSHLFCHIPYQPKTRAGKSIRTKHTWHHHRNEKYWYAVSFPVHPFDGVFRTGGDSKRVPVTQAARLLGKAEGDPHLDQARSDFASRSNGRLDCSNLWLPFDKEPAA